MKTKENSGDAFNRMIEVICDCESLCSGFFFFFFFSMSAFVF